MQSQSFWRKHAADSDWQSRYIEFQVQSDLTPFTQTTIQGTPTALVGNTGLVLINSAAAGDGQQFQWPNAIIQPRGPSIPTGLQPSSYEFELEFVMTAQVGSPVSVNEFAGLYPVSAAIAASHNDSMGIKSPAASSVLGLDFFSGGINTSLALPAGTSPPPAAISSIDTASHEYAMQVIPKSGDGKLGEVKLFIDGNLIAWYGKDGPELIGLTLAALAPAFGNVNAVAGLTAAQRTVTITRVGWAVRQ